MNIAQIRYFVVAAQVQNLSQAAQMLHLSQPALSKSISKLEQELGMPLFVRRGKAILLNEQGRAFLSHAWISLRELDNLMLDMQEQKAGGRARVTVGVFQAEDAFTEHLMAYAALHPEVELDIQNIAESPEEPDINQYDVMIYADSHRFEKLRSYSLGEEDYLLAVPADHALAQRASVSLEELGGQTFVFMDQGRLYVEEPYYFCAGMDLQIKARYMTSLREQHRMIIASGAAVGFVPRGCARSYEVDLRIRLLPIRDIRLTRRIRICFKRDKHLSPACRELKAFLLERLGLAAEEDGKRERTPQRRGARTKEKQIQGGTEC